MGWAQIVVISFLALSLVSEGIRHGKRRRGEHNVVAALIGNCVWLYLLYAGGFFAQQPN